MIGECLEKKYISNLAQKSFKWHTICILCPVFPKKNKACHVFKLKKTPRMTLKKKRIQNVFFQFMWLNHICIQTNAAMLSKLLLTGVVIISTEVLCLGLKKPSIAQFRERIASVHNHHLIV